MGSRRGKISGRLRLAAFFALLLLALSAIPVLASEPISASSSESADFTPPTPEEEEIAAAQVPGAEAISKAIGEYEREEREHEAWLATPEATLQREQSRRAYSGLSATESQGLLRRAFPRELEALNNDPSRYLSDAHLVTTLGASGAVVKSEGEAALLETTLPLRTEDEEGKLAKVDLSLEATAGGFETENAVSNVRLPGTADKGIEVGEEGVEISQQGAAASAAQRFGDKNLFYPSVLPDTDLMAAATSFGAELYDQLRSEESPEDLRFDIAVPQGAELRSDGHGGAEVLREGDRLTLIPKPSAKDAQGTDVPLQTEVQGGSLVMHVSHRTGDYAYPILVDPIAEDWVNQGQNWYGGNNWAALSNGAWQWTSNNSSIHHEICCWEGSHAGLMTIFEPVFYGPEQYGQWSYSTANEHVYIPHIWLIPFNRADNGCGSQQPHDYAGLWNPDTEIWSPIWIDYAKTYGNLGGEGYGQALIIGEGSGPPGVWLACQRILYSGGAAVWLEDWDAPVINSVSGMPSGWIKKDATQRTINVTASDEGLGVQSVRMISPGSKEWNWNQPSCTGLYGNRCANTRSGQITYESGGFPFEGEVPISVQGIDPTGKGYNPQNYTLFVDGTSPTIKLSGQLAGITEEEGKTEKPQGEGKDELSLPTYNLKIEAEDGNESQLRSGVKEIAVYLDESQTPAQKKVSPGCPQGSCPLTMDYALQTIDLTPGEHTLKIIAVDWAGNEVKPERKIKFEYIPATGMKEEYVLQHIPLPDGQDHAEEAEAHGPEIAVNVMNGNVVYHERDVDVQTPRASLELERFYNSQQPEEKDTQWGRGWSITQSPELRPKEAESPPQKATMTKTSAITSGVNIPSSEGESTFSSRLHAEIDKSAEGYEVSYKGGAEVSAFDANGRIEETRYGDNSPLVLEESEELLPGYAPIYNSSFGSSGTGNGQFNHPAGSAVDAEGDIWVVDENNDRVQEFNGKGEYVSSFGSSGSGNGQFGRPTDIAIDAEGHLWVTDAGNSRVEEFSANGEYLSKFGSYGTGNGQFHSAETLAIDAGGSIWVGDTYNGRLEKFTGSGEFIEVVGSKGSGQGQMIEPTGVAVGPDSNVWVADWGNQRVAEFSESGEFVRQFGSAGTGDGQFQRPDVIDVDTQGNVWVGDQNNDRIQRFNQEGDYVEQFGATGSGEEQFNFGWPMGLTTDAKGNIWVSDTGNNRVQRWRLPGYAPIYNSSFGSSGTGNGQFNHPAGSAVDAEGDIWVVDENNDRVQEFNGKGEYVSSFGSSGSGNGQFGRPTDIAIDAEGHLWVTDAGNSRVEEFSANGEYLSKFGSYGTGNGQFHSAETLAIDAGGSIWVGDTYNGRLEKFTGSGEFIEVVGSKGSGQGQMIEPTGVAVGPDSNVWVADWGNQRVAEFSESGEFVRQFGSAGTGDGQFQRPDVIDVDTQGNVWVGDQNNDRIQRFNQEGDYVEQFGATGSGEEQFNFGWPMGLTTDAKGNIWVSDTGNNRVQRWTFSTAFLVGGGPAPYNPAPVLDYSYSGTELTGMELTDPAAPSTPRLSLDVTAGLVSDVEEEEGLAPAVSYEYEAGNLIAKQTAEEEATFTNDGSGRLKRIELANGTWAEITYDSLSRATAVTVDPAGAEEVKTTHFWYGSEPRETKVWGGGNPEITYSIGEDGSIFKWSYTEVPPAIDSISGSLWANRNSTTPIENKDHTLFVTGSSPHEIASVQILVNGNAVLAEKTCEDPGEPPEHNCEHVTLGWITNAAEHAPGQLNLEAVVTDFLGHSSAERFFVTIPAQPPADPEAVPRPSFDSIKLFREEYGLDRTKNLSEEQLNRLIFELLYEWERQDPSPVKAVEKWGVPMRTPEVEEMEFRERYINQAAQVIPEWGEEHAPSTYGGFYVDNRAGGILYVGFTENQQSMVESLKNGAGLISPASVEEFPTPPDQPFIALEDSEESVAEAIAENDEASNATTGVELNPETNQIEVGATNTSLVGNFLSEKFGGNAPIRVFSDSTTPTPSVGRFKASGPVNAGDAVGNLDSSPGSRCTAGFGARDQVGWDRGEPVYRFFTLTAGHCFSKGEGVKRALALPGPYSWKIGTVTRYAYGAPGEKHVTDAEAIHIDPTERSGNVFFGNPNGTLPMLGVERPKINNTYCWSGILGGTTCGPLYRRKWFKVGGRWQAYGLLGGANADGDSGGPVWNPYTQKAVGMISIKFSGSTSRPCHYIREHSLWCPRGGFTPLLPFRRRQYPVGIQAALGVEALQGQ